MRRSLAFSTALLATVTLGFANDAGEPPQLQDVVGKAPFVTNAAKNRADARLTIDPFLNSAIPAPPQDVYDGRLFQLRHDYPTELPEEGDYPWKEVTNNGPITLDNAQAYVEALKGYVANDMKRLLLDYENWNSQEEDWWQSIWIGTEREPIHGMIVGSQFPAGTLLDQDISLTTYVYMAYDARAAKSIGDIWGTTRERAFAPVFDGESTQYADGSVIVKFAFVTACGSDWAPMEGAAVWPIYSTLNIGNGSGQSKSSKCPNNGSDGSTNLPSLTNLYFMQFDMIVKDKVAAPETGWVFSTLVYDKDAPGSDIWDKMVVLGATWGGDPDVINTDPASFEPRVQPNPLLKQSYVNPDAPEYSRSTLAWDGRLSGPNDGALASPAWAGSQYYPQGIVSTGCLGCHSTAQYPMKSFLYPTIAYPPSTAVPPGSNAPKEDGVLVLNVPGTDDWMKWFQSRSGDVPMDKGSIALDYDMVTAFQAIPMWQAAMKVRKALEEEAAE
ncbi:hypothetical protein [Bauldia sp.]|uniref:hypothetical protein n=1 Tax=Bauldia sp. TaxID=2575872 RepID=UPI003BAD50A4